MAAEVRAKMKGLKWAVAVLAFAAIVASSTVAWREYRLPARVQAALPAVPRNLASKPAVLGEKIAAAERRARSRADALAGVAELGRLYHANGWLREAEACWWLLRAEQPRDARWYYYLADLRRTAGDDDAVSTLLGETVRLAPTYAAAWLQLADFEFKTGRINPAEAHYRQRLALVAGDPYARLGLARVALQRDQRVEARQLIEQIVHDTPDFSTAHNLYAEMLASDGRTDEAFRQRNLGRESGRFREAADPWLEELHDACYDPTRLTLLATQAFQTKRSDSGISLLERVLQVAPDDPAGYEALGTHYLEIAKPAKAQAMFERARELPRHTPHPVMLSVNLAESLRLQQKSPEALAVVREELTRFPESYELNSELGAVLVDLGRIEESVQAYRNSVALAPNDADANFSLGSNLLALGRRDEAVGYLQRSLTLQPTYPKTLMLLGQLAFDAGRLEEAKHYWQPLYDSHPEQAIARHLLALYHLRVGDQSAAKKDSAAAEQHYRDGLAIDPDSAELNTNLGILYLLQGRPADALAPFESFHRLRPKDPQSSLFLGQLYAQLGRVAEARTILTAGAEIAERAGNRVTASHCREILALISSAPDPTRP
jgi:HemY protein